MRKPSKIRKHLEKTTAELIKALDHCTIPIAQRLVNNIYKSGLHPERNE